MVLVVGEVDGLVGADQGLVTLVGAAVDLGPNMAVGRRLGRIAQGGDMGRPSVGRLTPQGLGPFVQLERAEDGVAFRHGDEEVVRRPCRDARRSG